MSKKAAIYARVSTSGQSPENQIAELTAVAARMNWKIVKIYTDHGISGSRGRNDRKAFDELNLDIIRREFDLIMAWSVDRLGRSLQDLVGFLDDIHAKGIDLYLHQQGIDTTTPAGTAMFQLCGVFAQFEQAMIRERVMAGLSRAKANGKTLGRPRVSQSVEASVRELRGSGKGIKKIAKELGIGVSVVQRIVYQ